MKVIKFSILFLTVGVVSCSGPSQNGLLVADNASALGVGDTIYSSDEFFIQDIDVKNNLLLLQISHEQAAFILLDKSNRNIDLTVNHGEGPDDIVFGKIMKTCANNGADDFVICDNNVGKIINVGTAPEPTITGRVNQRIVECGSLCFSDSLIVGHLMGSPEQCFITTGEGNTENCAYYLTMSHDIQNKLGNSFEYVMSNCFAVNPQKNRLLSFNYFFDCVAAYSLDGTYIASNRHENDVTDECTAIINQGSYWSYCHPYAGEETCFIKAMRYEGNDAKTLYALTHNPETGFGLDFITIEGEFPFYAMAFDLGTRNNVNYVIDRENDIMKAYDASAILEDIMPTKKSFLL